MPVNKVSMTEKDENTDDFSASKYQTHATFIARE